MSWIKGMLDGVWIYEPKIFPDERGYFFESFNASTLKDTNFKHNFVQDNEAKSTKGVLRGLHYQVGEAAQAKLVRVITGSVLDVIVDIRPSSKSYGEHMSIVLDDISKRQMYVPRGFAHGYLVLSETAIFAYKCDNYYNYAAQGGIIFDDKTLGIDWGFSHIDIILSKRDTSLPAFGDHKPYY